jgi:hypothetical protein
MSQENPERARQSWHDDLIYGFHLRCADPERDIWRSELVLDIDHTSNGWLKLMAA